MPKYGDAMMEIDPRALVQLAAKVRLCLKFDDTVKVTFRDSSVEGAPAVMAEIETYHQHDGKGVENYLLFGGNLTQMPR